MTDNHRRFDPQLLSEAQAAEAIALKNSPLAPDIPTAMPGAATAAVPTPRGKTVIEQAYNALVDINEKFQKHVLGVNDISHNLTSEGYIDTVAAFQKTAAAQHLDALEATVNARAEMARRRVDATKADLRPKVDTAAQLHAQRTWARVERLLESKDRGEVAATARRLLAEADDQELATLAVELPFYLEARGVGSEWLDDDLSRRVPKYAAVKEELHRAKQAQTLMRHNIGAVRRGLQNGRPADRATLVPPSNYDPDRVEAR